LTTFFEVIKHMGFGLFKKIKQGLKRAITGIGKAGKWVVDKVVKPVIGFAAPVAEKMAPILDQFKPGLGTAIGTGAAFAEQILGGNKNSIGGSNTDTIQPRLIGGGGHGIRQLQ
jgi:sorbitol-specific phosphotransferase system component IIBC